jgi:hypothetical protein
MRRRQVITLLGGMADVRLKAGERWRYEPPRNHTVAWIAIHQGSVTTPTRVTKGEIAVFEESNGAIEVEAQGDAGFILGSAIKHPHDLVLGHYSVHTNPAALERGDANIARIGRSPFREEKRFRTAWTRSRHSNARQFAVLRAPSAGCWIG